MKAIAISILSLALSMGACGSKTPSEPTKAPPATATPSPEASADAAPATTPPAATETATVAAAPDAAATPGDTLSKDAPSDVAAAPADATTTASGLAWKVIKKGTGTEKPHDYDTVSVYYVGWTTDGKSFDSAIPPAEPVSFPLNRVIAGWTEGVQLMSVGDRVRFWIPEKLAYQGQQGAPAGMLVFDVELVSITPGKAPIPAPADVAAVPADAQKTASGLAYKVLVPGKGGDKPKAEDKVKVHYTGWTTDGKMFDSSVQRGEPAEFPLNRVIPGWTEALQLMEVGQKNIFWIPEELAYKGRPGAPQGMLVFEVELLEFTPGPKPIEAPADVAAPPKDAKTTASGLAYKVLQKGKGDGKHPTTSSNVTVNYTGWTTDGKMFDSSVQRGQPATFAVTGVIAGWTEGLQLMEVGEKTRFWIPVDLAYKNRPGKPAGMLVFDVELISIQ